MSETKKCQSCREEFTVDNAELEFLDRVSPVFGGRKHPIPSSSLCYECRQQRKLSYRNEKTFYPRTCDLSGKPTMSIYAPGTELTVYSHHDWWSDKWDAMDYGRDFDFSRPFFPQFFELHNSVPMMALDVKHDNENCDFTNLVSGNKNCYFIVAASFNEDSMYTTFLQRNRNVVDCFFIFDSELCYECIDCYNGFDLQYCQNCSSCNDSQYLYSCRSCANCFGCVSLVSKNHHILNKPYPKDQYQAAVKKILSNRAEMERFQAQLLQLRRSLPHKYYDGIQNESISGDHISYSKNTYNSFDCTYLEDCANCTWLHKSNNCRDVYAWGLGGELGYECHLVGNNFFHVLFSESCWDQISNLLYCRYCVINNSNLFGCVGLKRKQYCIFNKQYSKDDYEALASKIIEHMKQTGEWGEFFPMELSPFAYNESVGQEYYPLSREEVAARGLKWKEDLPFTTGKETISWNRVPSGSEVSDDISKEILACKKCQKNYRITSQELKFYRKMKLGIPENCFHCRHESRLRRRNSRHLVRRFCEKCGEQVQTTYSPDRPELVYCEECYLKEVY